MAGIVHKADQNNEATIRAGLYKHLVSYYLRGILMTGLFKTSQVPRLLVDFTTNYPII